MAEDRLDEDDEPRRQTRTRLLAQVTRACARALGDQTGAGAVDLPTRLCEAVVAVLPVDGAGLSVQFTGAMSVPVGASGPGVATAEQIQFTLGEGPCWQARANPTSARAPVVFEDLADPTAASTLTAPVYAAHVVARTSLGAVASCCRPLTAALPACLTLYRHRPTRAWDPVLIAATTRTVLASLQASAVLDRRTGRLHHPWLDGPATTARGRVWVAEQVLTALSGLDADGALWLLRAVAHARDLTVDQLADDLLTGRTDPGDLLGLDGRT